MKVIRKNRLSIRCGFLVAVCVLALLPSGCGKKKVEAPPTPAVTVADVVQEQVPITMDFPGTVKAVKAVDIIPRVSGYIYERYFTEGNYVNAGEPLYLIDPRPYKAKLDAVVAQLEKDKANLIYWKSEEKRYTDLAKYGAGSEEKKETAVARADEALAAIDKDKADIEDASLNLSFTNVKAPFHGRIQDTKFNLGALVEQQKSVLTTLVQMDPIYVIFNVSRRELFEIQSLQRKGLIPHDWTEFKSTVLLPDGSEYAHQGHVNFIGSQIDPATDTLMMRVVLPNPAKKSYETDLVPGQFVPVRLILGEKPDALMIPKVALVETQAGASVFVVGKDNKVESRKVGVGTSYKGQWIVKKGLKKGERVVIKGTQKVRPGMTVDPKPASPKKSAKKNLPVPPAGTPHKK